MTIIQCLAISLGIRCCRTLHERETVNHLRLWCIDEWRDGRLEIPEEGLKILLEE